MSAVFWYPVTSVSFCTALPLCLLGFLSGFFCFFVFFPGVSKPERPYTPQMYACGKM